MNYNCQVKITLLLRNDHYHTNCLPVICKSFVEDRIGYIPDEIFLCLYNECPREEGFISFEVRRYRQDVWQWVDETSSSPLRPLYLALGKIFEDLFPEDGFNYHTVWVKIEGI